jgi:hypothetical protein
MPKGVEMGDPLSRKVSREDRQGIETLFNAADVARRTEDMHALVTLYDFPIYVGTDSSDGRYQGAESGMEAAHGK